ncbi:MAG TPA: hypothetical protein VF937_17345 [Chloroflexota bacterium]
MNEHLPSPSVWPLTVAGGFTLLAFGVVTSLLISGLGLVLMMWGLSGWIQDMRHG